MCGTGAHTRLQKKNARKSSEASAWRETNRQEKRGEMENTKGVEFDTIVCWRETKKPNPQARLFNLQTVTASRFAFNGQHDRRGMVMWAEKESAGKSRNAQSDVRAVQSKNERRELKQNSQSARERARVCHGCTHTVATEESEAS